MEHHVYEARLVNASMEQLIAGHDAIVAWSTDTIDTTERGAEVRLLNEQLNSP